MSRALLVALLGLAACVALIEPTALISLAIASFGVLAFSHYLLGADSTRFALLSLVLTQAFTLSLYCVQRLLLPEYFGFTGPEGGIGTDDHFFYSQAAAVLPETFPLRGDYFANIYYYSRALGYVTSAYYWLFGKVHPLQVLLLNSVGLAFVPLFVLSIARSLGYTTNIQRIAFALALICPFLIENGVILLREGWIAAVSAGAIAAALEKRVILGAVTLLLAYFLRVESLVLIIVNLQVLAFFWYFSRREPTASSALIREFNLRAGKVVLLVGISSVAIAIVALNPTLILTALGKAVLGRPDFVDTFIRGAAQGGEGTSTLLAISQQAWPIRIVGSFLFFFGGPFLSLDLLVVDGVFVPRYLLQNLFAVFYVVVFFLFLRVLFDPATYKKPLLVALIVMTLIDFLAISLLSLQFRHKTLVLPLMYVVAAAGVSVVPRTTGLLALLGAMGLVLLQILYAVRNIGIL